ncbi:MAG TPA: MmgE/PrpD family protein [Xanthobacteraceae bacterium]|jgi:2-methylcitrate dehydratase PrpD|nr:MmgE/PrpD family protein [Xanthobacteraceae bacterium]
MDTRHDAIDRRTLIGAGAALVAMSSARAAEVKAQLGVTAAPAAAEADPKKKLSELIADFVVGFDLKNGPPLAIERTRLAFTDTIGVMLAGSREHVTQIACEMVKQEGSAPAAGVVGQSFRASPQLAALANGVAAHAMDYDFSYIMGQPMVPIIPALLPLAEQTQATPSDVMAAFIVGFEVASRMARANTTQSLAGGWHAVGTIGTTAAAAACARLMKLPAAQIPDVIGISASLAGGFSSNFGTMTKPLHAGQAARNGMMAALLGARGFTANASALEGNNGYFRAFARGLDVTFAPFHDLGRTYDIVERGFKPKRYPCGGLGHTAIDATLEMRDQLLPRLADIAGIKASITRYAAARIGPTYPASIENAKFSMPYLAAYTLLHGAPMLAAFTEPAIADERVRAAARLVSVAIDPEFADIFEESPSRLIVSFADGSKVERLRYYASGTLQFPLTPAQIETKFMDCAAQAVNKETADKIFATLQTFGEAPSFDALWPLLRGT